MTEHKIAVIGAGAMGAGIACVISQAGYEVLLKDIDRSFVERGLANIKRMYQSRVLKGVLTEQEAASLFAGVKGTTDYDDFGDVDLVIEAALEEIEVKTEIFKQLDATCPPRAILASNTSALSISQLAAVTKRPPQVLGMHFFNPAQTMKLIEIVPGIKTAAETVNMALSLSRLWGKIPITVDECPGFLVNRLLFPYLNESLRALAAGVSAHDLDAKVVEFGMPMGPLALLDMTGIDICHHVSVFLHREYGERFAVPKILSELVKHGQLGQKSGAGIYLHAKMEPPKKDAVRAINPMLEKLLQISDGQPAAGANGEFDVMQVILPMFNEAIYALQEKVVRCDDVDVAMEWGCGLKRGLLTLANDKGLAWCLESLEKYQSRFGVRYTPAWLLRKLVRAKLNDFSSLDLAPVAVR